MDYTVQFETYQGVKKENQVASSTKLGLRRKRCSAADEYMNNYFTSFRLLTRLGVNNICETGVLNKNRLRKRTAIGNKQLQKKEHGHFEQRISSIKIEQF